MNKSKQDELDELARELEEAAPDPARYGREKPELESGMGRLDNNDDAVPENRDDATGDAVENRQSSSQLNAEELEDDRDTGDVRRGGTDSEDGTPNMAQTPHYINPSRRKKKHL